ncbi:MAG TPA: dihydrodipicolinate synthase family protein [Blastocatellia bacterium]|nr:dihydrodipicolinate synthase family protein [Blastocatellia bacterium]
MNYIPRKGLNVPTVTIVDDAGRVLGDEQRQVIRHVIQQGHGADVIFGNGTTGEWNRLSNPERLRLIEISIDEVRQANAALANSQSAIRNPQSVEAWIGVNGSTRAEVLTNFDAAIQLGADAAVIAPLAINDLDEGDIVRFFLRDLNDLLEASGRDVPVFLYDNADINAPQYNKPRAAHIRTHIVKDLSRLPWIRGIKVSASRRVLGNYTKAALHFKQPGEFGIYIGNAMLIFDWFRPRRGVIGRGQAGVNEWLLNDALPVGVVSGPGNVLPREWQKAWRVCWAGDEELMDQYADLCQRFEMMTEFGAPSGQYVGKMLACLKYALELDGVIASSLVCAGTQALTDEQKRIFSDAWSALRDRVQHSTRPLWQTTKPLR